MRIDSIRARMTFGLTLFIAVLTFAGGFGLWWQTRRNAFERDRLRLQTTVSQVRIELDKGKSWEQAAQAVRERNFLDQSGEVELWKVPLNGQAVRHFSTPPMDGHFPMPPPPPREGQPPPQGMAPPQGAPPDTLTADASKDAVGNGTRSGSIPPLDDPSGWLTARLPLADGVLIVAVPWHRTRHDLDRQAITLFLLGTLTTLATGIGAWILVGRTLLPIEKLAAQARERAGAQTGKETSIVALRAPSSDGEVRELVATFNALLDNVARTARVREQFHTSASHELRTPLQALSGTLHLALSRPRTNEEYQQALQEARAQSERLNALTRDLLVLNQLGTDDGQSKCEMVNIAESCDLALSGLERPIATKRVQLDESLQSSEVFAPPSHLEMLTRNLLENAVKYAPVDGKVSVNVSESEPRLRIWNQVESAESIAPGQDLNAWFEPFHRPDAARASTTGGNGLGLAICKAICDANHWTIELQKVESGIEARVWFSPSENRALTNTN